MTNPVILLGTQSSGETLPVQVDAFGRLVAEGLQGEPGQPGPPGPEGPAGELPDGAYEGAVLGWKDGEVAWIDSPSGLPEPYGEEGSVLMIQDGIPQWVSTVPPTPSAIIQTGPYQGSSQSLAFRDVNGSIVNPPNGWDAAARELPGWSSSTFTQDIQGVSTKGDYNLNGVFDLNNVTGMVLTINLAMSWELSASGYSQESFTCDNANVLPLFENNGVWGSSSGVNRKLWNFQFLCNRPEILGATFTFRLTGDYLRPNNDSRAQFQSWILEDPGEAALRRQYQMENQLEAVRKELRLRSEFI